MRAKQLVISYIHFNHNQLPVKFNETGGMLGAMASTVILTEPLVLTFLIIWGVKPVHYI